MHGCLTRSACSSTNFSIVLLADHAAEWVTQPLSATDVILSNWTPCLRSHSSVTYACLSCKCQAHLTQYMERAQIKKPTVKDGSVSIRMSASLMGLLFTGLNLLGKIVSPYPWYSPCNSTVPFSMAAMSQTVCPTIVHPKMKPDTVLASLTKYNRDLVTRVPPIALCMNAISMMYHDVCVVQHNCLAVKPFM